MFGVHELTNLNVDIVFGFFFFINLCVSKFKETGVWKGKIISKSFPGGV